jgi:hypothetical protein
MQSDLRFEVSANHGMYRLMANSSPHRNHADAIARLAAAVWHWLQSRNAAPANPRGEPPEKAIWACTISDDERADEVVSVFQEVAADFANSGSELNARYAEMADEAMDSVDLLELVFSMPIHRVLQACRASENARRMCAAAGIQLEAVENARYEVVLAVYALRGALKRFFELWHGFAPEVKKRGIAARSKDPVLSYFDWMLAAEGRSAEEIAEVDGSFLDLRAGNPEHYQQDRTEAVKATRRRIDRMAEFMSRH